ncbi:hypothetical protein [Enterococcus sp. C53]
MALIGYTVIYLGGRRNEKENVIFFVLGISLFSSSLVFADSQTQGEVAYVEGALEFDYAGGIPTNLDFGDHPLQTAAAEN